MAGLGIQLIPGEMSFFVGCSCCNEGEHILDHPQESTATVLIAVAGLALGGREQSTGGRCRVTQHKRLATGNWYIHQSAVHSRRVIHLSPSHPSPDAGVACLCGWRGLHSFLASLWWG